MAMSLVAKYPNRLEIIPELIATGVEELEHFQRLFIYLLKNLHLNFVLRFRITIFILYKKDTEI